jgi:hypothetical protein
MDQTNEDEQEMLLMNRILDRLQEEPVCYETKKDLMANYLRQNALTTLSALPPEAFFCGNFNEEKRCPELLPSLRGLSEKESLVYKKVFVERKKSGRIEKRLTKRLNCREDIARIKRMGDLPNFLCRKREFSVPHENKDDNVYIVISLPNGEADCTNIKSQPVAGMVKNQVDHTPMNSDLSNVLGNISIDSCDNHLSSASSEFY